MKNAFVVLMCVFFMWVVRAEAENKNFALHSRLQTSYNDNVTLAHQDEISDLVQTVLLGVDFKNITQRNNFLLQADVARNFYFENASFNNTMMLLRVTDKYELSDRTRLSISDSYIRAYDPQSFDDAFGRTSGRYRTIRNNMRFKYQFDLTSQALFEIEYANEFTAYSRRTLDDSLFHQIYPRAQYAIDQANRVGLGYSFIARDFDSGDRILGHAVIADFEHDFTKQLMLVCKVGEDFLDADTSGSSRRTRYEASLVNDIDEITQAALKYRRGLSSYAYSKDFFDSYQVSAVLTREVTSRILVKGAGFYGEGEFEDSGIKDEFFGAGAEADYAFFKQMSVGLNYNFTRTNSNRDSRSYDRNLIGLQIEVKF